MRIVDAQVHVWGADTPERPWPPGGAARTHRAEPFGAEELIGLMDEAGVDRAVLVPPSYEGDRNDLALAAAARWPDRFAVMGRLAVERPESRDLVAGWRSQPGMLGMRFTFHTPEQRGWLTDGTADWLWDAAERHGIPLMILPPGQIPAVDALAERHPGLRLVIDHLAMNSANRDAAAFADLPQLLKLARHPNVAVKATSLPSYTTDSYPYRSIHGYIRQVVDAFGPRRTFWGTDITRLPCTYRQGITLFTEELPFLSEEDKRLIMGDAILEWLGWPA